MSVDVRTIEPMARGRAGGDVDHEDNAGLVTARVTSAAASVAWIVRLGLLALIGLVIAAVALGV